jgi:glycosyltransferase involved in cell wall biosynthesis
MHAGWAGGVERYFDGLCRAFDRNGMPYRGLVFGRGLAGEGNDLPLGTIILGPARAPLRERWRLIQEAVLSFSQDSSASSLLIASHFALYGWPMLGSRWRRKGVRLVSHFHGPWADESAAEGASRVSVLAKRLLEHRVYQKSAHLISASEAFRQLAIARYGVRPERITAVHAGMDAGPTIALTQGVSRQEARARLGWPMESDRRIVFCVRRITRRMGLENLIDAAAALVGQDPRLFVVIGGKGPMVETLRARVARLGLDNHVRFPGFVSDADLPIAYRAADFTIVPSVALEGFGLVILESWAAGTPVLVTPVGGMPEVVRPFVPECVMGGSGVDDLVRGMKEVLSGEQGLPHPQECVDYVCRVHSWEIVAPRVFEGYSQSMVG